MLGFSIIGTPNGFQISSINLNRQLSLEGLVDLDNTVINIFPETDILMVSRDVGKDFYRHYFVYYRYATEINNTRPGTYYGSVVTIEDRIASPQSLSTALLDLADVVKRQCLDEESRFQRNITGLQIELPDSVRELSGNLEKAQISDGQYDKSGFFSIGDSQEIKNYKDFIDRVFNDPLLSDFQTLYVSKHKDVLNRVKEKNILKVLNLSKLEETKRQEKIFQQQQEQEKLREQERKHQEAKLQKELQEKEAVSLKQPGKTLTLKELAAKVVLLESRIEELEKINRSFKNQSLEQRSFDKLRERVRSISWTTSIIVISSLIISTVLLVWYFSSSTKQPETISTENSNVAKSSVPIIVSTRNPIEQSDNSEKKIQLNYLKTFPEVKKVRDLIELVKSKCTTFCPTTEDAIAESILSINKSIKKKNPNIDVISVLDFELKDITGTITFEISRCCDLSKTDPVSFKLNTPNP